MYEIKYKFRQYFRLRPFSNFKFFQKSDSELFYQTNDLSQKFFDVIENSGNKTGLYGSFIYVNILNTDVIYNL